MIILLSVTLGANYASGGAHALLGWCSGPESPPPYILLQVHGISATALQILLGALVVLHILPAWRARRHLGSGLALVVPLGALVLSGLGLYYAGDESLRSFWRWSHIVIGLALPLPLFLHVIQRRR